MYWGCGLDPGTLVSYHRPNVLTVRPLLVMAGEGLPSTSLSEPASLGVDGGTSPAMRVTDQDIGPLVSVIANRGKADCSVQRFTAL